MPSMTTFGSDLILARLERLHPKRIDLSLERMERLLAQLGHPERRLPPVVHIAGTNGKGSVLAFLDAMLAADGNIVHRYISPHLVHFNERIQLAGRVIEEAHLAEVLDRAEKANGGAPITFFEITTAAAMLAFSETPADFLLLETGLGGRLDATNVVERPALTLISSISLDHEDFLGDTIEAIAFEKAGILKPGVSALFGPQRETVHKILAERAAELNAPLRVQGIDWELAVQPNGMTFSDEAGALNLPRPSMQGDHQLDNATLAVAAARSLGASDEAIASGLQSAFWPARLQRLTSGPLVQKLGLYRELWLDGGHNPGAGECLARHLDQLGSFKSKHLVIAMLKTKNLLGFLEPLAAMVESITFVPVPNSSAGRDPIEMAALAGSIGIEAEVRPGVEEAIAYLADRVPSAAYVLICGNLYLAGHILRDHG